MDVIPSTLQAYTGFPWWKQFFLTFGILISTGKYQLQGWSKELSFYLFVCPNCEERSMDYLHGHREYITCQACKVNMRIEKFFGIIRTAWGACWFIPIEG